MRPALFWNVMQHRTVVSYRRFGTNNPSNLQGSSSPRISVRNYHSLLCKIPKQRDLLGPPSQKIPSVTVHKDKLSKNLTLCIIRAPIFVTSQSKAWVCGRSLAGTAGSNTAESMDVSLLWVLWVFRKMSLRRADHSSRGFLASVCVWVWLQSLNNEEALAH
jgi:hypothetical protein